MVPPESSETPTAPVDNDSGEVVYRRVEPAAENQPQKQEPKGLRSRAREIAPAITPLIIGFTLLLALISALGYLSVQRMNEVSFRVLDLEHQHSARLGLLLRLRLAVTKVNNEARARQDAEARGELKPPFDFRLGNAQEEVQELLRLLERPPLSQDPVWRRFRDELSSYLDITQDLRRYSLEGFPKFRIVDEQLNGLLAASTAEQSEIFSESEAIEQNAVRSIRSWSVFALLVGFLVAAGTVWEVQRRFKQMRRSMLEAGRERAFTNQLLEGMVSAVAAIDADNRLRSANTAFFEIFPSASIGASIYEKFALDDAMKMLEAATALRATKATYHGRWVCCADPGEGKTEKTFDVYSSPLAIDGDHGQIITLVDATEAAQSERGLRRSESLAAVGQATAQVAHEIRNPLGSIRLGVSMLRDNVTGQDALNTIELVERGINHLSKLVVDVTQFSRQKALERAPVDLHELLDRSLDLLSESVQEKQTPLQKKLSDQKLVGNWDGHQLRQVVVNLVSNAIEASPKGSPVTIATSAVTLQHGEESGGARRYARLSIADQGKGMDPTTLDRIFEPFYSTKKRGTGLGLAIVKQIVEQHDGVISVESEIGKGTRFVIDLPL